MRSALRAEFPFRSFRPQWRRHLRATVCAAGSASVCVLTGFLAPIVFVASFARCAPSFAKVVNSAHGIESARRCVLFVFASAGRRTRKRNLIGLHSGGARQSARKCPRGGNRSVQSLSGPRPRGILHSVAESISRKKAQTMIKRSLASAVEREKQNQKAESLLFIQRPQTASIALDAFSLI